MTQTTPQELWLWTGVGRPGGKRPSIGVEPRLPSPRMVKPAFEWWRAASLDGSTRVGSVASGRSKAPTRANTSPPGACSASRSSAARKNCSRPDSGVTTPLSGGFQFEQIPAAVKPAGQQALFLLQLRQLARELVDIGVQEIEAVA